MFVAIAGYSATVGCRNSIKEPIWWCASCTTDEPLQESVKRAALYQPPQQATNQSHLDQPTLTCSSLIFTYRSPHNIDYVKKSHKTVAIVKTTTTRILCIASNIKDDKGNILIAKGMGAI